MKPSFGWDLAGYGDSGCGLCRADREGDTITATILHAPFICRPRHKLPASIHATVDVEVEMLRRFAKTGNTYLDVPIDLQLLSRFVDYLQDERALYYWQLVKRPVDHVFQALEPLASNLGYAVARTAHILGRLATEGGGLNLDENLFETYPAATLQLVWATNEWTEEKYKGGKAKYLNGKWQGQVGKKAASPKKAKKNDGLAVLANNLGLRAAEGFEMNDDEFDAVLCAVTGCVPDCTIEHESLAATIRKKLIALHGQEDWINKVEPPSGYVVFDRLPPSIQIHVAKLECPKPNKLLEAIQMKTHPKPEDVKKVEEETYKLLGDIGLPFKKVSKFEWVNEERDIGAQWSGKSEEDGVIEIFLGCEPGAIAHEIGHGFHEALNYNKKAALPHPVRYDPNPNNPNQDGEAVGETVRFFVEQRMGSSWRPINNKQTLEHCHYDFGEFRKLVRGLVEGG
jgi:hypothetical protein